jgi:3-hydroxyacyl-CoA dehydrogenase
MEKIAIIGSGLIGRSWAIVFARAGHAVSLHDNDGAALTENLGRLEQGLADLAQCGLIDEPQSTVRARITPALDLAAALDGAAYVQENVGENLQAKRQIFEQLDRLAAPECILASSTSTIAASLFTGHLVHRARALVAHPVNPPHLVPLVELCPAPWTAPEVLERARSLHQAIGQVPIVVRKEVPGFILNRLQAALLCEAMRLFEDGYATADDIDKVVRDGLGLRWSFMGPFETIDLNAPGGVVDYAQRYGTALVQLARDMTPREWHEQTIRRLEAERRTQLPATELGIRQAWRDRRLMALVAHKRAAPPK